MRLTRQKTGQTAVIGTGAPLGRGGQARVVVWPFDNRIAAKIYFGPSEDHKKKLAVMIANPPTISSTQSQPSIAWPIDLLHHEGSGKFAGFLMLRVIGCQPIINFYNPAKRLSHCPLFNYRYLHRTARNLAHAVSSLHQKGYVIGDVNESNILVSPTALITLVDTDSFQVRTSSANARSVIYRCPVGKPEYTPPELQGKNFGHVDRKIEHDLFGLAVLVFQLLMEGFHPFAGGYNGPGEPPLIGERIARGFFPYGKRRTQEAPTFAPPIRILYPALQNLFIRCFEEGHSRPASRPTASEWYGALEQAEKRL